MTFIDPDNPLAAEILQEAADAYFLACKKMVDSLEAWRAQQSDGVFSAQDEARRFQLLEDAAERVYFVLIQREALKLSWYDSFFDDYGVPDEVRAMVGQRRRK